MTTEPVAVQLWPVETEQLKDESAIAPTVPVRSVTVIVAACSENATICVAEQPFGTQLNTDPLSLALWFVLFTE